MRLIRGSLLAAALFVPLLSAAPAQATCIFQLPSAAEVSYIATCAATAFNTVNSQYVFDPRTATLEEKRDFNGVLTVSEFTNLSLQPSALVLGQAFVDENNGRGIIASTTESVPGPRSGSMAGSAYAARATAPLIGVLRPDLGALASGNISTPADFRGGGGFVLAEGDAYLQDVLSIRRSVFDAASAKLGFQLTSVTVQIGIDLDGSLDATPLANGSFGSATAGLDMLMYETANPGNFAQQSVTKSTDTGDKGISRIIPISLTFRPDTDYTIALDLIAFGNATGQPGTPADFLADFLHTAKLTGVNFFADPEMTTPLDGFTLDSQFGFDWSTLAAAPPPPPSDVPEPAGIAFLGLGAVALGLARRRR